MEIGFFSSVSSQAMELRGYQKDNFRKTREIKKNKNKKQSTEAKKTEKLRGTGEVSYDGLLIVSTDSITQGHEWKPGHQGHGREGFSLQRTLQLFWGMVQVSHQVKVL